MEATNFAERIREACDFIRRNATEALSLKQLAERAGLSPFHFQRRFKALVGVTPKQFLNARRMEALKSNLRSQPSVTHAIYETGFGSSSRVYERVDTALGMTPAAYRQGGAGVTISYVAVDSPLGRMMLGATDRGLCFLQFAGAGDTLLEMLKKEYPKATLVPMPQPWSEPFVAWIDALNRHLRGTEPQLDLPLDLRATAFQLRVWTYLQSIPYGSVQSYGEVAAAIGRPSAARAVARACASNRVAVVIPCHRVIRGTGDLGGYRWGLERKRALLDQERLAASGYTNL